MLRRRALLLGGALPALYACSTPGGVMVEMHTPPALAPWQALDVPGLGSLIASAWGTHPDIEVAQAAVQTARAQATQAFAERQPLVRLQASHARQRRAGLWSSTVNGGVEGSWTPDLSGGTAKTNEALALRVRAQAAMLHAAQASLACEVVAALLGAAVDRQRWSAATAGTHRMRRRAGLVERRVQAGLASRLEAGAAHADVAGAQRQEHRTQGEYEETLARLRSLCGATRAECEDAVARTVERGTPRFDALPHGEVDMRVLLRRPDLAAAEIECQAVSLEVAAAERARLPKVNLGGVLNLTASSLSGLGTAGALAATLSQMLQWDVFDAGRASAGADYARANERMAAARFRQRAWAAAQEAAIALARYRMVADEHDAARQLVARLREGVLLARAAREHGVADALAALDAEQALEEGRALALDSAQLLAATVGRALHATAGPLPGIGMRFVPDVL